MDSIINQLHDYLLLISVNLLSALEVLAIFWLAFIMNMFTGYRLNRLGIYPRHVRGLPGILCSPFLHASFNHLFFNSLPLVVLVDFILTGGMMKFIQISLMIMLISGFAVWVFGRRAWHVGASGLIMGYFGYLLAIAYRAPSLLTIPIAIVCLYYFGGLLLSLFPKEQYVSWEGHLFGFLAGVLTVFII